MAVGNLSWGVILSSGVTAGAPSGDICYFFCNAVNIPLVIKDKISHLSQQTSYATKLENHYYRGQVSNAVVVDNKISTLNQYNSWIYEWEISKSSIYFWAKDSTAYHHFYKHISGSTVTYNYLKCRISGARSNLKNNKKAISFNVEECDD